MHKILLTIGLCLVTSLAYAEAVPEDALEKDYVNCMGGESPQQAPERNQYCNCVRDAMRNWTLDQYGETAMAGSKATDAQHEPSQLQDIAKACISKVLK